MNRHGTPNALVCGPTGNGFAVQARFGLQEHSRLPPARQRSAQLAASPTRRLVRVANQFQQMVIFHMFDLVRQADKAPVDIVQRPAVELVTQLFTRMLRA